MGYHFDLGLGFLWTSSSVNGIASARLKMSWILLIVLNLLISVLHGVHLIII